MSRLLSPQETVALQQDTDYLNADIPVWGSRVLQWQQMNGMFVLIYHSPTIGYVTTDITDLGTARIQALAEQSNVQGYQYFLPQAIVDVISEDAEIAINAATSAGATITEIGQAAATAIGQTLANLIQPVVGSLMVPLVIAAVVLGIYLFKKG